MANLLAKKTLAFSRTYLCPRIAASVRQYSDKTIPYYDPVEGKQGEKQTLVYRLKLKSQQQCYN